MFRKLMYRENAWKESMHTIRNYFLIVQTNSGQSFRCTKWGNYHNGKYQEKVLGRYGYLQVVSACEKMSVRDEEVHDPTPQLWAAAAAFRHCCEVSRPSPAGVILNTLHAHQLCLFTSRCHFLYSIKSLQFICHTFLVILQTVSLFDFKPSMK